MRKSFQKTGTFISRIVDFFYPPFRKYMTLQFFRYGFAGGVNTVFAWVLFYVIYNFVLNQQVLPIGPFTLSSHIAALVISFPFSNTFGFLMQKYITFTESTSKGTTQFYRYFVVVFINLGLNAFFLKLLVDCFHFWTTPSEVAATLVCIAVSYFSQTKYTFK